MSFFDKDLTCCFYFFHAGLYMCLMLYQPVFQKLWHFLSYHWYWIGVASFLPFHFPGSSLFFSFSRCGHLASFDYLIIYYSFYLSLINILLLIGTLVPNLHPSSQSQPSNLSLALANGFASYFTTKFEVLYLLSPYPWFSLCFCICLLYISCLWRGLSASQRLLLFQKHWPPLQSLFPVL